MTLKTKEIFLQTFFFYQIPEFCKISDVQTYVMGLSIVWENIDKNTIPKSNTTVHQL